MELIIRRDQHLSALSRDFHFLMDSVLLLLERETGEGDREKGQVERESERDNK